MASFIRQPCCFKSLGNYPSKGYFNKIVAQSSHHGTGGSDSDCSGSGGFRGEGLIPSPVQLKDPVLPQLWHRSQPWLGYNSWPGNFICLGCSHQLAFSSSSPSHSEMAMSQGGQLTTLGAQAWPWLELASWSLKRELVPLLPNARLCNPSGFKVNS